ncbi:S1/P1 nuclease [Lojkania enalia]|uniref:S1/P1 nuclease n=1 Tax=Lojkania enalia TaxID=147567 RepID=A0A9P4KA42_9PLEO|nr:S1/P1 nuclease [Didymosphaeria enalia]
MTPSNALVFTVLPFLPRALSWGTLGHTTVALIAQNFISPKTVEFTQHLLNDTSSNYLANVATWADSYRYTAEGGFSSPFHYIDALDSPPETCNVDFGRDCPEEGCIVSAIANYTTRAQSEEVGLVEQQKALKWVIHFLGDIHQPLHVENLNVGGNTINVTFEGEKTNLHHIWDSNIPEKLVGGYAMSDSIAWAATLTAEIKNGTYAEEAGGWLQGLNGKDGIESAMLWANDANAFICSAVVPDGVDGVEGKELDGAYYDSAIPVVQLQIAKAGYRLAAWLNYIATGKVGLKGGYGVLLTSLCSLSGNLMSINAFLFKSIALGVQKD